MSSRKSEAEYAIVFAIGLMTLVQDSTSQLENPFAFQQLCGMRCNAPAMTRSGECLGSETRCLMLLGALVGPLLP